MSGASREETGRCEHWRRGCHDAAKAQHAAAISRVVVLLLRGRFALMRAAVRAVDPVDRVQRREHDEYRHGQEPAHESIIACFRSNRAGAHDSRVLAADPKDDDACADQRSACTADVPTVGPRAPRRPRAHRGTRRYTSGCAAMAQLYTSHLNSVGDELVTACSADRRNRRPRIRHLRWCSLATNAVRKMYTNLGHTKPREARQKAILIRELLGDFGGLAHAAVSSQLRIPSLTPSHKNQPSRRSCGIR